jgi:hypothetical protein
MTRRLAWPITACVSGAVLNLLVVTGVTGPVRLLLTLWFLSIGTGMSIVPALDIPEPRVELLIGIATSIVIDTLIATLLAAVGELTLASAIITLGAICLFGTAINLAREWRQPGVPR